MGIWDFFKGNNKLEDRAKVNRHQDKLEDILMFPVYEFNENHRNYERFKTGLNESGGRYEHYDYIEELNVRGIFDSITAINFPETEYYNLIFEKDQVYLTHNNRIKDLVNDMAKLCAWEKFNSEDERDLIEGEFWIGRTGKTNDGTNLQIMISMDQGEFDMSIYGLKRNI